VSFILPSGTDGEGVNDCHVMSRQVVRGDTSSSVCSSQEDMRVGGVGVAVGRASSVVGGGDLGRYNHTVAHRSVKSYPASICSSSTSRGGRDAVTPGGAVSVKVSAPPPPPPQKFDADAARSIYDRNPEHCYENLEKVGYFVSLSRL